MVRISVADVHERFYAHLVPIREDDDRAFVVDIIKIRMRIVRVVENQWSTMRSRESVDDDCHCCCRNY